MKTIDEETIKYTAFSPATWVMVIQLLMIHWKFEYKLPVQWWVVFLPLEIIGVSSILFGFAYLIGRGIGYSRSRMGRGSSH